MPEPVAATASATAGASLDPQHPWPGLAAFGEDDRLFFRGREGETAELLRLVRRERLTVLFGRSGLGKSSLLNAGLFPKLREDLHLPIYLRIDYGAAVPPRQQLWAALAAACAAASIQWSEPRPDESPWAYFHRAGGGFWNVRRRPLLPVLVFDQFEEYFTLGQAGEASRAAATTFLDELADLVEDRPSVALRRALEADPGRAETVDFERRGCKVVVSFREDFLAEMEGLKRRMPSLMRNRYRLLPMSGAQARAVIAAGGDLVAQEVGERIVGLAWRNRAVPPTAEEEEQIEVHPALLSVICSELNLRRLAAGLQRMEPSLLQGAEAEILADFYERSLRGRDPRLRQFIEDELITAAGYRDSFAYDDAIARPGVGRDAVQQLVAGRLLLIDERLGVRRLELTHDVLTRVVKDSREARRAREAEAAANEREREAARLQRRNRFRAFALILGLLATAGLLAWAYSLRQEAEVGKQLAKVAVQDANEAKIQAQKDRDEARSLREVADRLAASAAAAKGDADRATQAADAASTAAHVQAERAAGLERHALASELIVAAGSVPVEQRPLQLLLGAEAVRRYPERLDAQVAQLARLLSVHRLTLVELDSRILASAPMAGGARVLLGTASGRLVLLETASGRELGRWQLPATRVDEMRVVPGADDRLVVIEVNGQAQLVRLLPGRPLSSNVVRARYGDLDRLALSADGRWLADADDPRTLVLTPLSDGAPAGTLHRIPMPAPGAPRCLSFEVRPGQLLLADAQGVRTVDLGNFSVQPRPLPSRALAFSPDCGKALLRETADDGGVRHVLHDLASGAATIVHERRATQPRPPIEDPYFVAGGRFIAARYADGQELWPVSGGEPFDWQGNDLQRMAADAVAASPDGRWLAVRRSGRSIEIRQRSPRDVVARVSLSEPAASLHVAPDGQSLLAVGNGRLAQVVQLENRGALRAGGAVFHAEQIEFSADGSHLGASSLEASGLQMWSAADGTQLRIVGDYGTIEFSPNGVLAAGFRRSAKPARVEVFELVAGGRTTPIVLDDPPPIEAVAFDQQGRRIGVAVKGTLLVYDVGRPRRPTRIPLGTQTVSGLSFHPREPMLAIVDGDGTVAAFGVLDGKPRWRWKAPGGPRDKVPVRAKATAVGFSPDGRWLVVGHDNGTLSLHDPATGGADLELSPRRGGDRVRNLVFIEGTSILSAGDLQGGKHFWDLASHDWLGFVGPPAQAADPNDVGDLRAVAISANGRRAALRHADDTVSLQSWAKENLLRASCRVAGRNLSCNEWRRYVHDERYRRTCEDLPGPEQACAANR